MRYLTFDWWKNSGDPPEMSQKYWSYIDSIKDRLTPDLHAFLLTDNSLHDSQVLSFSCDFSTRRATLVCDGFGFSGDLEEPRHYEIVYHQPSEVTFHGFDGEPLTGPGGFGDIGYDEVELLDSGLIEHRILFSTGLELRVQFARLEFLFRREASDA